MGKTARRRGRPAAGLGALGREVLDARDDGDGPQHRAQRRLGAGPGRAGRQRAVRLGLLPPADPDVRQDRAATSTASCSSDALDEAKASKGVTSDLDLDADDLQALVDDVQGDRRASRRAASSRRTRASSWTSAIHAVFDSWNTDRAMLYRRQERIPDDLGTAVNVVLDGVRQPRPRTRAPASPSPATRPPAQQGVYGDYLQNAQGEDVVAGIRNTVPLADLSSIDKTSYDQLMQIMATLENALPGPVRHRVHHRARQAVDAADPGRQAHRGGGVPDRHPAGRPGPDRHGRGAAAGHRRPAGPADVPAVRRRGRAATRDRQGHGRLAGRGRRQGGLRLVHRGRSGRARARRSSWSAARPTPTTSTA